MADRFPRAYVNEVPKNGDRAIMQYVDFEKTGIGARSSGTPRMVSEGPQQLEHVGKDASGGGGRRRR